MQAGTSEPNSQESVSSDLNDEITSYNEQLLTSVRQQSVTGIESALSNKSVKINYQNVNGDSALHLAVRKRSPDIVEFLIKREADVSIPNINGKTPLRMVRERLEKEPNDANLQSIEALLKRAQAGTPRIRPHDDTDNSTQSCSPSKNQAKRRKIEETETYTSNSLRLNFHGPIYQTKLLALYVKRAIHQNYEFSLASEMDDAGALDDIVLRYKKSDQSTWRFVQAKHKQNAENTKISITELKSIDDQKDFCLHKYFISFCKIIYRESFGNAIFENFTILTNTEFDFIDEENTERIKLWKEYFEEEHNLNDDPILNVKNYMFKPRKFKISEIGKRDLYELFKSNFLECVLINKEINQLNAIKIKLELTKIIKKNENLEKVLKQAKLLISLITSECANKKRKTEVIKLANEYLKLAEGFLNENRCQQSVSNLKKSIEKLKETKLRKSEIFDHIMSIQSEVTALEKAEKNYKDSEKQLEKYSDLQSTEGQALDNDRKKLFDDERELRKMKEEISKSEDLEWIKEEITKDILKKNHRFSQNDIVSIKKKEKNEIKLLQRDLNKKFHDILLNISMIKVALNDYTFEKCLDEFLAKFCIITNYPNEMQLSSILQDEIGEKFSLLNANLLSNSFEREMINFLKEKVGRFYYGDEGEKFYEKMEQKINIFMSIGLCKAYAEQLDAYGISFDDKFKQINKFNDFILNESQKVLHLSTKFTRLCAIKVFRNLTDSGKFVQRDSFIFIRLGTILHRKKSRQFILNAFKSGTQSDDDESGQNKSSFDLCVIECREECWKNVTTVDSHEQNLIKLSRELLNILSENPLKKILIIAPSDDKLSEIFQNYYGKIANIQGALDDSGINEEENPQQFEKIDVQIGFNHLDDGSQDRVLAKNVKFQEKDSISFNQLIDKKLARRIIDSENLLRLIENEVIQIGDEKAFHSINYVEDFYITRKFNLEPNPMDDTNNISEADLVKKCQKFTLLSNDAGMGKSTVLTSVAKEIRKKIENAWIVRIDLSDHGRDNAKHGLNRIKFKELEINKGISFVSKMIIRGKADNANIRLQRALFEVSLEKTQLQFKKPPIVILLDGFDEISPGYNKETSILISTLKASDVSHLWITTRPHEKNYLQNKFDSNVYHLQPLTKEEQVTFLDKFLKWYMLCGRLSVTTRAAPDRTYPQIIKQLNEIKKLKLNDTLMENISDILGNYPKTVNKLKDLGEGKYNASTPFMDKFKNAIKSQYSIECNLPFSVKEILKEKADEAFLSFLMQNLKENIKSLSFTTYIKDNLLSLWSKSAFTKDGNFHETPLHLKMLTEVIVAKKRLFTDLTPFDLYENFVNIKFTIHHKNKARSIPGNQAAEDKREDNEETLNKVHNTMAVRTLFTNDYDENLLPDLYVSDELKRVFEQDEESGRRILRVGLLASRPGGIQFINHSYSEFFFCKYLMKNSTHKRVQKILVEKILVESAYGLTRQFLNDKLKEETIELMSASKKFISQNLRNNSENNIRTRLTNEKYFNIIKCLKLDEIASGID